MVEGSNVKSSAEPLSTLRMQLAGLAVRPDVLIAGVLFAAALLLFIPRLAVPDQYIYDEVYHAYTAGQYAAGNADAYVWYTQPTREGVSYEWTHPPLGKLLITAGILIWGDTSFGWRFFSAVFGALCVVAAYVLALTLSGRRLTAFLAAGLLLLDGLFFVQSRTAMLDIFGATFMLGAFIALYRYLTVPLEQSRVPLLALGVCTGLAVATKWNAAYASAIMAAAVGWHVLRTWRTVQRQEAAMRSRRNRRQRTRAATEALPARDQLVQHLGWLPVALVIVPGIVYVSSYIPFFLTGHGVGQLIELQRQIYYYHSHLTATHDYQSQWWSWVFALRPVWYYVSYGEGTIANIYANGNPLLYWAFLPSVVWLVYRWWGTRNAALAVFLIGFFGQWLPWALVPRIAFIYHFLPVVPFGCLAVAVALTSMWEATTGWRIVALSYVGLVVLSFVFFFPIYSAIPLDTHAFESRLWLRTWR